MGGPTRFTGVTVQPYNDNTVSRITSFNIMYSNTGHQWSTALNSDGTEVCISLQHYILNTDR